MPVYNPSTATSSVTVQKAGTTIGSRPTLNLIEGTNATLTVADNAGLSEVDITVASTAGASSTAGEVVNGTLSTSGEGSIAAENMAFVGATNSSGVWPAANRAIYVAVQLAFPVTVYQVGWWNGTAVSGNVDVGIYDETGARLVSTGSTAQAGTSTIQTVDIADTALVAGTYFLAMAMDNTTGQVMRVSAQTLIQQVSPVAQQATAFPLPTTSTMATLALAYLPALSFQYAAAVI